MSCPTVVDASGALLMIVMLTILDDEQGAKMFAILLEPVLLLAKHVYLAPVLLEMLCIVGEVPLVLSAEVLLELLLDLLSDLS